jgi:hypothetical protein
MKARVSFAASYNQMLCPINASNFHQSFANLMPAVRCRWPAPDRGATTRLGERHVGTRGPQRGLSPWQQVFDGVIGRGGWSISQPPASLRDDRGKTLLVLLFSVSCEWCSAGETNWLSLLGSQLSFFYLFFLYLCYLSERFACNVKYGLAHQHNLIK